MTTTLAKGSADKTNVHSRDSKSFVIKLARWQWSNWKIKSFKEKENVHLWRLLVQPVRCFMCIIVYHGHIIINKDVTKHAFYICI